MSDNRDRLNEFLLQQIEELKAENAGLRKDLRMLEQAQRIRELEEMVQAKGGGREAKRPRGGDEKDEAVVQGEKRMKGDAERPSFDKRESGVATAGNNSNGTIASPSCSASSDLKRENGSETPRIVEPGPESRRNVFWKGGMSRSVAIEPDSELDDFVDDMDIVDLEALGEHGSDDNQLGRTKEGQTTSCSSFEERQQAVIPSRNNNHTPQRKNDLIPSSNPARQAQSTSTFKSHTPPARPLLKSPHYPGPPLAKLSVQIIKSHLDTALASQTRNSGISLDDLKLLETFWESAADASHKMTMEQRNMLALGVKKWWAALKIALFPPSGKKLSAAQSTKNANSSGALGIEGSRNAGVGVGYSLARGTNEVEVELWLRKTVDRLGTRWSQIKKAIVMADGQVPGDCEVLVLEPPSGP